MLFCWCHNSVKFACDSTIIGTGGSLRRVKGAGENPMKYTKLSDNDLVTLSATGDELAFEAIVKRHSSLVMGLALARLGNRQKSEDIVQETFLRVFRKLSDYSRKAKFTTWLYRIASNLIKDNHKYARRHPVAPLTTEQVSRDFRSGRTVADVDEAGVLKKLGLAAHPVPRWP